VDLIGFIFAVHWTERAPVFVSVENAGADGFPEAPPQRSTTVFSRSLYSLGLNAGFFLRFRRPTTTLKNEKSPHDPEGPRRLKCDGAAGNCSPRQSWIVYTSTYLELQSSFPANLEESSPINPQESSPMMKDPYFKYLLTIIPVTIAACALSVTISYALSLPPGASGPMGLCIGLAGALAAARVYRII
jgi:hypothetical protein